MPKIVDHAQRRVELVDALLRVAARDGFAAASVRTVAEEAGWSAGTLRHYYPSQDQLVEAALATLTERAVQRLLPAIEALAVAGRDDVLRCSVELLEQLLPLDATRRDEMAVWMAMLSPGIDLPSLARWRAGSWHGIRQQCRRVVARLWEIQLVAAGEPSPTAVPLAVPGGSGADILAAAQAARPLPDPIAESRAAGLHALVDGLALHAISFAEQRSAVATLEVLERSVGDVAAAYGVVVPAGR
jgi:AcrR family transcriptional regulator